MDLRERMSVAAVRAYGLKEDGIGNILSECRECIDALEACLHDTPSPEQGAEMTELIVAAAIQIEGLIISLPRPARHGQVIASADAAHVPAHMITTSCQGFLTSHGRFVNRVQARQLAFIAKQVEDTEHDRDLVSEDLW